MMIHLYRCMIHKRQYGEDIRVCLQGHSDTSDDTVPRTRRSTAKLYVIHATAAVQMQHTICWIYNNETRAVANTKSALAALVFDWNSSMTRELVCSDAIRLKRRSADSCRLKRGRSINTGQWESTTRRHAFTSR